MENIKLVIWDLDETFWQGTLSDNTSSGVHAVVDNIQTDYAKFNRVLELKWLF